MAAVKNRTMPGQIVVNVNDDGETVLQDEQIAKLVEMPVDDEEFAPLVRKIDQMIDRKEKSFREAEAVAQRLGAELRRLRQMRRAAVPEPPAEKPPEKAKRGPKPSTKGVSDATLARFEQFFLDHHGEQFIRSEVGAALSCTSKTVATAVEILREQGKVRLAGQRPLKQGPPAALYTSTSGT